MIRGKLIKSDLDWKLTFIKTIFEENTINIFFIS